MPFGIVTRYVGVLTLLALAAAGPWVRGALAETALASIDCANTEFAFASPDYTLTCQRMENDVAFTGPDTGGKGDVRNELIVAVSAKDRVYLATVSMRLIAARFGFTRSDLRDVIGRGFTKLELSDWRMVEGRNRYEIAEFRANDRSCAAWQRYANPSAGIFKRHVFGFGCSENGVGHVYEALGFLDAPGD